MSGDRISPTAHYTGYVWARNGLSPEGFATLEGRLLFESLRGVNTLNSALGGDSLERYLLARHRSIDRLLEAAIDGGAVSQVVEVACGLSPRGWRFGSRYGDRLTYVEADLPGMADRKREALRKLGSLSEHHRVEDVDALAADGPGSLQDLAARLDHRRGTAIITEGLTGYLDGDGLRAMWGNFARVLGGFPAGRYISDLHLGAVQNAQIRAFRLLLSAFIRGSVHLHFEAAEEAVAALAQAGFDAAEVRPASELVPDGGQGGAQLVHIIEASTSRSTSRQRSSATRRARGRIPRTRPSG